MELIHLKMQVSLLFPFYLPLLRSRKITFVFRLWREECRKLVKEKWNGGFAPYGYSLQDGKLYINETEAEAIRTIFDKYVNSDMGANALARYLANHGVGKIERQNGKNPLFNVVLLKRIVRNLYIWVRLLMEEENLKGSWHKR